MSTAEINSDGGFDDERVRLRAAAKIGKACEKKARGPPPGKVEMKWLSRGELVDGHVEWHMLDQRLSSEESWRRVVEQQAAEPRAGPSNRLRTWDLTMSGCKAESPVAPP